MSKDLLITTKQLAVFILPEDVRSEFCQDYLALALILARLEMSSLTRPNSIDLSKIICRDLPIFFGFSHTLEHVPPELTR